LFLDSQKLTARCHFIAVWVIQREERQKIKKNNIKFVYLHAGETLL
jgi:hypothetical protein